MTLLKLGTFTLAPETEKLARKAQAKEDLGYVPRPKRGMATAARDYKAARHVFQRRPVAKYRGAVLKHLCDLQERVASPI